MPDVWTVLLQPLILVSGVGILLLSTTARFGQLEAELKDLPEGGDCDPALGRHLAWRARRFRAALTALYVAVATLCVASIGGAVMGLFTDWTPWLVIVLTCAAFAAVLVAAVVLVTESAHAADMFRLQIRRKFRRLEIDP